MIEGHTEAHIATEEEKEEERENLTIEDYDQVEWYEDEEPEGMWLPSTT